MPEGSKTLDATSITRRLKMEDVTLAASEEWGQTGICIELVERCTKVTVKIDPAIGSIVEYAQDEALSEVPEFCSL
jgi:hypothetical protein